MRKVLLFASLLCVAAAVTWTIAADVTAPPAPGAAAEKMTPMAQTTVEGRVVDIASYLASAGPAWQRVKETAKEMPKEMPREMPKDMSKALPGKAGGAGAGAMVAAKWSEWGNKLTSNDAPIGILVPTASIMPGMQRGTAAGAAPAEGEPPRWTLIVICPEATAPGEGQSAYSRARTMVGQQASLTGTHYDVNGIHAMAVTKVEEGKAGGAGTGSMEKKIEINVP